MEQCSLCGMTRESRKNRFRNESFYVYKNTHYPKALGLKNHKHNWLKEGEKL